jgi:hypothetical protein
LICLARYSPTFIEGAGQSDGEILETLWSTLNHVGQISQTMMLAHQTEVLDSHMGDNNWKKLVNIGKFELSLLSLFLIHLVGSLCQRWKRVQSGLTDAEAELNKLSDMASPEQIKEWDLQGMKLRSAG